jgi:elongation factor G
MITTSPQMLRNMALIGHGHVGKTSLADAVLHYAGLNNRIGSVDDGTSLLDTDTEERNHHISVNSHTSHLSYGAQRFNIVDTPGYPDFLGQVVGALRAVEAALICIDANKGIEVQTQHVWKMAGRAGLARMIVLTKCEMESIEFEALIESIWETFGRHCLPFQVPLGRGTGFHGVLNLLKYEEHPDALLNAQHLRQMLIDTAVESDDQLMIKYLEEGDISEDDLVRVVRSSVMQGYLVPIFCTSVKCNIGIEELLEQVSKFCPAPEELNREIIKPDGSWELMDQTQDGPLIAQIFKQKNDPFLSKLSFIRVYSGVLKKDSIVTDTRSGTSFKIHQLMDVQGDQTTVIDEARTGDIVAIAKQEDLKIGDTLTCGISGVSLPPIPFPHPMVGLAVEPKSRADQQKISGALHRIEDEDPTFIVQRDDNTKEIIMMGMSELHLNIVEERLRTRDKVQVVTHRPKIPYRETISEPVEGGYRHKKQSGGAGQFAEVHLKIGPLPTSIDPENYFTKQRYPQLRGFTYDKESNTAFLDCVTGGSVPNQFIPAVMKGVVEKIHEGCLVGYRIQNLVVELKSGKDHPVDSNEAAFRTASRKCFEQLFTQARPLLLDPIVKMEIYIPDDKIGAVSSDISSKRGHLIGMDTQPGGYQILTAFVPQSEVMSYARSLIAITGGKGSYTLEMSHYEILPPHEQYKIVRELGPMHEHD